jgi:hypothetical protein
LSATVRPEKKAVSQAITVIAWGGVDRMGPSPALASTEPPIASSSSEEAAARHRPEGESWPSVPPPWVIAPQGAPRTTAH